MSHPTAPETIRAITFDAGGTLIYPHPSVGEVYAAALHRRGLPADAATLDRRFKSEFAAAVRQPRPRVDGAGERQFWRRLVQITLGDHCPHTLLDEVFAELWEAFSGAACWRPFPDAAATVRTLRDRGYRVSLLSNADSRFRRTFVELGMADLFEQLFISSELGLEKPDRRIFDVVADRLGFAGPQILHVGDSEFHDGAAAAAGWQVVIVRRDLPDLAALLPFLPGPA